MRRYEKKYQRPKFLREFLPACLHHDINSFRLFREAKTACKSYNASPTYISYTCLRWGCMKLLFFQIPDVVQYLLSLVLCLLSEIVKEASWFEYLVLKEFAVSPT